MTDEVVINLHLNAVCSEAYDVWEVVGSEWISQDDFDSECSKKSAILELVKIVPIDGKTLIPPMGSHHIFALQVMCSEGLIEHKKDDGLIYYKRKVN